MEDAKQNAALEGEGAGRRVPPARLVRLALAFYLVVGALAVAWRMAVDGAWPWRAEPAPPPWPPVLRIGAGLAFGAVLIVVSRVWTTWSPAGRRLAAELAELIRGVSTGQALVLAAVSGLAEEAFFRGALQPRVGWLLASVAFGLAHFHPRPGLRVWSLASALAGLGFGWLFIASGDLAAPALAHALVNAVNLRWLGRSAPDELNAGRGTARP